MSYACGTNRKLLPFKKPLSNVAVLQEKLSQIQHIEPRCGQLLQSGVQVVKEVGSILEFLRRSGLEKVGHRRNCQNNGPAVLFDLRAENGTKLPKSPSQFQLKSLKR